MSSSAPLYLIDAYGLIYRSYFAFLSRPLRNSQGENISALFGFIRTLIALLDEGAPAPDGTLRRPTHLAAVFDSRVPTFRHERYAEYKAKRQKTPDDLHAQVPWVEQALKLLGVPVLRLDRYEADDIIATLAERCRAEGRECHILSSDKDLLQLVGDGIYELRPGRTGNGAWDLIGEAEVKAEWGVTSAQILDLLSLTGDASDNVPGVKGIGDKGATGLLARYGSLQGIYDNIAGIEGALGRKLAEGREMAWFSRELIALDRAAPVDVASLDDLDITTLDRSACAAYLLERGLRQSAQALDPKVAPASAEPARQAKTMGAKPAAAEAPSLAPVPVAPPELKKPGSYALIADAAALSALLDKARAARCFALDFETSSLDPFTAEPIGFSIAVESGKGYYIPLVSHAAPSGELGLEDTPHLAPDTARELLAPLLADESVTVVAHNAKFDYEVTLAWGLPRWKARVWDSMVAAWLLDPERQSHALEALASGWLGLSGLSYQELVPKGGTFRDVPLDKAVQYGGEDADFCLRLKLLLEPCLQKASLTSLFADIEMPLLPILAQMEQAGILVLGDTLRAYGQELVVALADIEKGIYGLVGHEFNIASTKQLQEVLFVERRLKTGKKTKTGYSTDVAVLEELAREDPLPAQILRYRTLAKLKSTYVDTLADQAGADGRLRTHFAQTGTATGRLSSRDPNLQNIPIRDEEGRRIRAAFVAAEGYELVSADYSQIELVVLAHLSGDENLRAAFREGQDVHRRTASLIFRVREDEVTPDQRRVAKTINFGVMYGMSAFRLANELGISRTEAQSFIDAYFSTYSGIAGYMERVVADTERNGYAETLKGRRRYIPAIRSANKTEKAAAERVAVNTPIQGSAADIVKLAMLRVDRALSESQLPARLLLQVHDELILEARTDAVQAVIELVKREMEQVIELAIPLRASVEHGTSWGSFH